MRWMLGLAVAIGAAGCGYNRPGIPHGYTEITFSGAQLDGARLMATPMNGGVFVYARRLEGGFETNFRLTSETDGKTFVVPNGTYRFRAMGYAFSGLTAPHCGVSQEISLGGSAATVPIFVDSAPCSALPFSDPSFAPTKAFTLQLCPATGTNTFGGASAVGSTCDNPTGPTIAGMVVGYPTFLQDGGGYRDLAQFPGTDDHQCVTYSISGSVWPDAIPTGDPAGAGGLFPTRIVVYSGSCGGTKIWSFEFPRGLAHQASVKRFNSAGAPAGTGAAVMKIFQDASNVSLFLLAE
jgi:hypothetical protein